MKNAGGLPGGGGRPEEKTLFVTLWDLSLPTSEAVADGARRVWNSLLWRMAPRFGCVPRGLPSGR